MTFVRPLGTIRPVAVATMSTLPKVAQPSARQNNAIMVPPIAPAIGAGGVSTFWGAAGGTARPAGEGAVVFGEPEPRALRVFINPCLDAIRRRVAPAGVDQLFMGAILDQTAAFNRDDAIAAPHR